MKRPLPEVLYRVHHHSETALHVAEKTGGYRWDDPRADGDRRFRVLYTADSPAGALIEKLQKFSGADPTVAALDAELEDDGENPRRTYPISDVFLSSITMSELVVLDREAWAIDPCEPAILRELPRLLLRAGIDMPEGMNRLKAGDLLGSSYEIPHRVALLMHDTRTDGMVGIASRSSMDNPSSPAMHTNFNIWRDVPKNGSRPYVALRVRTAQPVDVGYPEALAEALEYLGIVRENETRR